MVVGGGAVSRHPLVVGSLSKVAKGMLAVLSRCILTNAIYEEETRKTKQKKQWKIVRSQDKSRKLSHLATSWATAHMRIVFLG